MSVDNAARLQDPPGWGYSLANVRELILACLDAVEARRLLEIGAFEGDLTVDLLAWAEVSGASIETVDPVPPPKLLERVEQHPELVLHQRLSHEVISDLDELPDVVVLDGDHNHFTLSEELRLIGELADRAGHGRFPLLLFHDVGWPHARRDTYYAVDRIPEDKRPPIKRDAGLAPGNPGTDQLGLPYPAAAAEEGGPANGTVTAIEDFSAGRSGLRFAIVPAFFGFGIVWHEDMPWSEQVAAILAPYDRHPVLQRLEANRVDHLVASHARGVLLSELTERNRRQEELLRAMLDSRALDVAERVSKIKQRGEPIFSREKIEKALDG